MLLPAMVAILKDSSLDFSILDKYFSRNRPYGICPSFTLYHKKIHKQQETVQYHLLASGHNKPSAKIFYGIYFVYLALSM